MTEVKNGQIMKSAWQSVEWMKQSGVWNSMWAACRISIVWKM